MLLSKITFNSWSQSNLRSQEFLLKDQKTPLPRALEIRRRSEKRQKKAKGRPHNKSTALPSRIPMSADSFRKCFCNVCSQPIEFELSRAGELVQCPHCGMDTVLYLTRTAPDEAKPKPLSTPEPQPPQLDTCRDCGSPVSPRAKTCPRCGAFFSKDPPRHGVFYYVFWGVVSLAITFFILGVVGFFIGAAGLTALFANVEEFTQARHHLAPPAPPAEDPENQARADYIHLVKIYDFTAKYYDSIADGKVPGVEFKLRNTGDRTLRKVDVLVLFKDREGVTISEEHYYPVLVSEFSSDPPLRPGYIWQMERDRFLAAKKVPSEWAEGFADARVIDVEFSK